MANAASCASGTERARGQLGRWVSRHAIVLWNTLYMEATLKQIRDGQMPVAAADIARLSPLVHRHINFQVVTRLP